MNVVFFDLTSPNLSGGMKEQDLMCIKLHGVNRVGLKKIIDFIYTAKLSLNMENLQDTLEAASFLQILPVLDFCKVFLISGVLKTKTKPFYYKTQTRSGYFLFSSGSISCLTACFCCNNISCCHKERKKKKHR